jgi:hypothetical protein
MKLEDIRAEIDYRRNQIARQRKDIRTLQRAGINSLPAEALLARMQTKVDDLCAERDKLVGESRVRYLGTDKTIKGAQRRGL